tara:strand:+ start:173299 stop:174228 length:930 start_codon:yes stop_codon:yes gene_type:complete
MFDQCQDPTIKSINVPVKQIKGIIESPNGNTILISNNAMAITIDLDGNILNSGQLLPSTEILSFVEYEEEFWFTTADKHIYVINSDLQITQSFSLDYVATSVAPLEDRSALVISYFDQQTNQSFFEYRSLPELNILATGFYGPKTPIISSVAFKHDGHIFLACCSKSELSLLKVQGQELINIQSYSEESEGRELNYSQLLAESKRFLVDNMTGRVKADLEPSKYMEKLCFFRNEEATHGAIAKRDNWIAFLNPNQLKMVNYDTKESYKFQTKLDNPNIVKVLKYHVICVYDNVLSIYDFRKQSLKFIMD